MTISKPEAMLTIVSIDEPGVRLKAQYNPTSIQITRSASWAKQANDGAAKSQQLQFSGQEGRSMDFELLFDDSEKKDGSVAGPIATLERLATVRSRSPQAPENLRRPHHIFVMWQGYLTENQFKGVIEGFTVKATMFSPTGAPIRATVNVKIKEAESVALAPPPAAPTAGGATSGTGTGGGG